MEYGSARWGTQKDIEPDVYKRQGSHQLCGGTPTVHYPGGGLHPGDEGRTDHRTGNPPTAAGEKLSLIHI